MPRTKYQQALTRSPRKHADEGIEDNRNLPGLALLVLAIVAMGLTLTAAGYGFEGWAWIAGIACIGLFAAGGAWLALEWRRQRAQAAPVSEQRQGH